MTNVQEAKLNVSDINDIKNAFITCRVTEKQKDWKKIVNRKFQMLNQ